MEQSLSLGLICIAFSALLELVLYYSPLWRYKRGVAAISLIFLAFGTGYIAVSAWWLLGAVFGVLCVYKAFSLLRLIEGRTNMQRLHAAGKLTFWWLTGSLVILALLILFTQPTFALVSYCVAAGSVALSMFFAIGVLANLHNTRPYKGSPLSDKELPTVTVAIPARNETKTLEACLAAVLASDYPKLEILVLDDCSQDKTAEVIRSFAHAGVRFVLGEVAPEDWLAKNYAYKQLLTQASGDYVLFMGVDIRLHRTSIRSLAQAMTEHNKTMVSVLPRRSKIGLAAAFVQPMRYWWELVLPARLKKWPPVLSSCWMINRKAALKDGGFEAVKRAILPERHFARDMGASYAFMRTSQESLITTHKDFKSQWHTAIRTRYPQLHRRPELVALQTLGILFFELAPFVLLFVSPIIFVKIACLVTVLLLTSLHVLITYITNKEALWLSPFNVFFAIVLDLMALNTSMYLYEFSEVMWKGRNVCIPVMRVIPKLPDIESTNK